MGQLPHTVMRQHLVELLKGRPGWRLEARATPGATPLWCYVDQGEVEYSVTADGDLIRLYVMATDQEIVFDGPDALTSWLQTHRPEALREHGPRPAGKARLRRYMEWE